MSGKTVATGPSRASLAIKAPAGRIASASDAGTMDRGIFQNIPAGIVQFSTNGRVLECNTAAQALLGYARAELLGTSFHTLICDPEPAWSADMAAETGRASGGPHKTEMRVRRKDGTQIEVQATASLFRAGGGQVSWIAVLEDIGGRKVEEQQLREAHKMEAVGRLAGGIAHDFNNLLTGVMLYCDLLTLGLEKENRLRHHVDEIRTAATHGAELIHQLLAVARPHASEPRIVGLNSLIVDMTGMLGRLIGEHIEVTTQLEASLAMVKIDDAQFKQVLMNLVLNARDAIPEGGRITIETANRRARLESEAKAPELACVAMIVRDTGSGMHAETRKRLFEPFFTTKAEGKGNGLGLATVYNIVSQNGGRIDVASELGKGSEFTILLPAVEVRDAKRLGEEVLAQESSRMRISERPTGSSANAEEPLKFEVKAK
jgi:two-component system, cell cycle sensor histidine kinase and response regulator CckA